MRLAIYSDGRVVVTTPPWLGMSVIERFLAEKSAWIREKLDYFKRNPSIPLKQLSRRDYADQKETALALVRERISFYNAHYGFSWKKVFIRNQKTRWGSCSSQKNISINYKIVYLPPRLRDYLIVHELCHLKEMNHSPRFWALVRETVPDYVLLKRELRQQEKAYR